jgi:hypothetical protein
MKPNKSTADFVSEINALNEQKEPLMKAAQVVWRALPLRDQEVIANRARQLTVLRNCGSGAALEIYAALCYKVYPQIKGKNSLILEQQFGALLYDARSDL